MKTNKTITYALACIKELARQFGEFVRVEEIARNQNLPAPYCQKILLTLSRAGIVESVKGRGFTLLKPVEMLTTLEVIEALSNNAKGETNESDSDTIKIINELLSTRLNNVLAELSVAEIVNA